MPDTVEDVLKRAPTTDAIRADLWDTYQKAASADELAQTLKSSPVPDAVKADLWDLKNTEKPADFKGSNEKDASGNAIERTWGDTATDVAIGAAKGVGNTVFGLGKMVRDYTPVGRISDAIQPGAFDQRPPEITPTNTPQKVGFGAEQIGEFFLPGPDVAAAGRLARAGIQGGLAAGHTLAQTDSPTAAGVAGVLTAGLPLAAGAVLNHMEPAEKNVMRALGPTKERFKAMAERLTPEILKRGLRGSREALQERAAGMVESVGDQIDAALTTYGAQPVGVDRVVKALETAKDAFRTTNAAGNVVVFEPRAVAQLGGLQKILQGLGADATVEQVVNIRRAWDRVVDQAGGFSHRAGGAIGVPLKDTTEAWAKREATGAIRAMLATDVPDLAAINKEWAFWKKLDDVLTQTLQRTQPHGPGLIRQTAETAGQVVGGLAGSGGGVAGTLGGAFAGGKLLKQAQTVLTSARWQLATAHMKNALADAIVSQQPSRIMQALAAITAATPGRAQQAYQGIQDATPDAPPIN